MSEREEIIPRVKKGQKVFHIIAGLLNAFFFHFFPIHYLVTQSITKLVPDTTYTVASKECPLYK